MAGALLAQHRLWFARSSRDADHPARGEMRLGSRSAGYPYPVVPAALLLLLAGRALENAE